jgi:hypothetical protein
MSSGSSSPLSRAHQNAEPGGGNRFGGGGLSSPSTSSGGGSQLPAVHEMDPAVAQAVRTLQQQSQAAAAQILLNQYMNGGGMDGGSNNFSATPGLDYLMGGGDVGCHVQQTSLDHAARTYRNGTGTENICQLYT